MQSVSVIPEGLLIGEKKYPLYSGSFHYWRHDRALWKSILSDIRSMGFHIVCTYMPWSVHEISPGEFDFGQIDPRKDVAAFLETCSDEGLYVLARPGPHINAELPWFGFPHRVVTDTRIQARTVTGAPAVLPIPITPFVMPSYASDAFYTEVGKYFDALSEVILPYIFPRGSIVALQADNEMSFFFRMRCYDVDYHPESIALYQMTLQEKYGSVSVVNQEYDRIPAYNSFSEIDPPRSFDAEHIKDLPYYLDWAEFQEYYINYGILKVCALMEERGLTGVPYFHNYAVSSPNVPFTLAELEQEIDIAGVDSYPQPGQFQELKRGAIYTSTMSRLPFIPEFLSGVWPWNRPLTADDQAFITQTAFMYGIRAINYYMLVERDRWVACPITRNGSHRPDYFSFYSNWNSCLEQLNWETLRPERDVLILTPRIYDRLRYVAIAANFPYEFIMSVYAKLPQNLFLVESTFGGRDNVQRSTNAWTEAFRVALEEMGIPYGLGDSDISEEVLSQYRLVIVPLFEWSDERLLGKLSNYVRSGGHLISGPRWPQYNLSGQRINNWLEGPPQADIVNCRVDFEDESVTSTDSKLWVYDADLWQREDNEEAGQETSAKMSIKPNQGLPFLINSAVGKGLISHVAAVFPDTDELHDGAEAYRIWAPWLEKLLLRMGIKPYWQCDNKNIELSILSGGGRRIICMANPTSKLQSGVLRLPGNRSLQLIDDGSQLDFINSKERPNGTRETVVHSRDKSSGGGGLNVVLKPYTVTIWEMI